MAPPSAPRLHWPFVATLLIVLLLPTTAGAAGFQPAATYPAGNDPRGIASGNLNSGGAPDLVTTSNLGGTLSVRLNLGNGTFGGSTPFFAGTNPAGVVVRDFDADSDADVVYARLGNDIMAYRPGNGSGGLGSETGLPANDAPTGVVAADFNFDGKPDLATANNISSDISVVPNNTTVAGTFAFGAEVTVASGSFPAAIATGDFNNDNKPDLATANQGGALGAPGSASVFYNTTASAGAAPAFTAATAYSTGNVSTAIASGDFNNDGNDDLAVGSFSSQNVFVLLSTGAAFNVSPGMPLGGNSGQGIAVGDFNTDGQVDIAAPFNAAQAGVKVFEGNGAGAFTDGGTAAINGAGDVTVNDFNGDGRDDLAVSGGPPAAEIAVLINDPGNTLPPSPPAPPAPSGGGGGGGGSAQNPICTNPTTLLVTCANPSGQLPGVCGPSFASIFPACYLPTVPPTVCGPSFGTILKPCQLPQPRILACGGFGTLLPQCRQAPQSILQVCGPSSGTILPACTGANNPVLVCGPSTGTVLPPCNFKGKIKAAPPLNPNKSATIDIELSCPPKKARAGGSRRPRATQAKGGTCDVTAILEEASSAIRESLYFHAIKTSNDFDQAARVHAVVEAGLLRQQGASDPEVAAFRTRIQNQGARNGDVFQERTRVIIQEYLKPASDAKLDVDDVFRRLTLRNFPPPYGGPPVIYGDDGRDVGSILVTSIDHWVGTFGNAVTRFRRLQTLARGGGKSSTGANGAATKRPRVVKRFRIRAGKTRRVKLKLSKKTVQTLVREARKSKRSKRVIPIRFVVAYSGKLQGRKIPVARMMDLQLRVDAKPKKRKKR